MSVHVTITEVWGKKFHRCTGGAAGQILTSRPDSIR